MTDHVRVAIVGGGIVGCSVLYSLAAHGWTDTVLLERREITSGSTWHAAGNVTYFGHYPGITRLYVNARRPRVSRIVPFRRGTLPVPETQALAASALPGGRDREGRGPS